MKELRERLAAISNAPATVARLAAPRVQATARDDMTTRRGNVPSYGKFGDVPIRALARPQAIIVRGPDWAIEKADAAGKIEGWAEIVADVAAAVMVVSK
jgi:hypothetical protein